MIVIREYPDYLTSCTAGVPLDVAAAPYDPRVATARAECYSHAFFQVFSQVLCIGYGLVNPVRIEEVWVTTITMAAIVFHTAESGSAAAETGPYPPTQVGLRTQRAAGRAAQIIKL